MSVASCFRFLFAAFGKTTANRQSAQGQARSRLQVEVLEDRLCPSGGYLLITDYDTHTVMRYDATSGAFVDRFVPRHSGGLNQPNGLIFGPRDHNLYVVSGEVSPSDQHRGVLRYDGNTGAFLGEFADGAHLTGPHAVIFGPDGNLYVGDGLGSDGQVVRYNGTTGAFMDTFVPPNSGGLARPFGLVFGPDGKKDGKLDLYVLSRLNNSVKRYDGTTGAYLGDFVASGSGGLDHPTALTFGPDGNLYVAAGFGTDSSAVFRFQGPSGRNPGAPLPAAGNTGAVFVVNGSGGLLTTFGLIFGPDGNGDGRQDLYLPSFEPAGGDKAKEKFATIKRYDGLTGAFIDTFVTSNSGGLDQPAYLIFTETDSTTLAYTGGDRLTAAAVALHSAAPSQEPRQAQPLLTEALTGGQAARLDPSVLGNAQIRIAAPDDNAAGRRWSHPKPQDDSEFSTPSNQDEQSRMDLLTILMREAGMRCEPAAESDLTDVAALDRVFADYRA